LLEQAVAAYKSALEVYTKAHLPQDWARTQNNLGFALWDLGTRSGGEEGRKLLEQAVAAYKSALEVYTKADLPQDWALTQNDLGLALHDLGTRSGGEEGRKLLEQAVAAYKSAWRSIRKPICLKIGPGPKTIWAPRFMIWERAVGTEEKAANFLSKP
jgi:tetratricopeptide (TPR) repeat protein